MKKILIIGNGFDLAHENKTSFDDFADYLSVQIATEIFEIHTSVKSKSLFLHPTFLAFLRSDLNPIGYTPSVLKSNYKKLNPLSGHIQNGQLNKKQVTDLVKSNETEFKDVLKNTFLESLYKRRKADWFNIEESYFSRLLDVFREQGSKIRIQQINIEFEEIKQWLIQYLRTIKPKYDHQIHEFLHREIGTRFHHDVVDFNYTDTFRQYVSIDGNIVNNPLSPNKIINIHGRLNDNDSIVFGYGNDLYPDYEGMKATGINEYLENLKTFKYVHNSNFSDVMNLVIPVGEFFEVIVVGHSLGETDKTLLNKIFESKRCAKIKLYKRSNLKNDYETKFDFNEKVYNLSRIVSDDTLRSKLLTYDRIASFP